MTESPQLARRQEKHETYSIVVNGRPKTVEHAKLSYEQVVHLAFENAPTGPNVVITVAYTGAVGPQSDGLLTKGQHVEVQNGTEFRVRATDEG